MPKKVAKPSLPETVKVDLETKAMDLIENVLKPRYVIPPKPNPVYNYIVDVFGKWNRGYFYFIATYACPGPNALSSSFERKFARIEFVSVGKFTLSYLRHTGAWMTIYDSLSLDDSLKAIQEDPWFQL
jgi:hypothetical protein